MVLRHSILKQRVTKTGKGQNEKSSTSSSKQLENHMGDEFSLIKKKKVLQHSRDL